MRNICTIEGCGQFVHGHGLCKKHTLRIQKTGSPDGGRHRSGDGKPMKWLLEHVEYQGDDCLRWPFGYSSVGYPSLNGGAHRKMCIAAHGAPPTSEHQAAHNCGNRWCVNPRHLRWATPSENQQDRFIHGTHLLGMRNIHAKLTLDQCNELRAMYAAGLGSQRELGERFGISRTHAHKIIAGLKRTAA